jgi:hypothetical protein
MPADARDAHATPPPLTQGAAFQAARAKDVKNLSAYENQPGDAGLEETFAESLAIKYGGNSKQQKNQPNLMNHWDKGSS